MGSDDGAHELKQLGATWFLPLCFLSLLTKRISDVSIVSNYRMLGGASPIGKSFRLVSSVRACVRAVLPSGARSPKLLRHQGIARKGYSRMEPEAQDQTQSDSIING